MKRAAAFIDGFNLFHALEAQQSSALRFDIAKFCMFLVQELNYEMSAVHYFTSTVNHFGSVFKNQQAAYLESLASSGVTIHFGEFRSVPYKCPSCNQRFWTQTEKQTDVALASELIAETLTASLDRIYVFSADSDFLPALRRVKELRPNVEITVVSTVKYLRPLHGSLVRLGIRAIRISPELAEKFLFVA